MVNGKPRLPFTLLKDGADGNGRYKPLPPPLILNRLRQSPDNSFSISLYLDLPPVLIILRTSTHALFF